MTPRNRKPEVIKKLEIVEGKRDNDTLSILQMPQIKS